MTRFSPLSLCALLSGCAVLPSSLDVSDLPIDQAIATSLDHLEQTYSFTQHKQLDWDAARADLNPRARAARGPDEVDDVIRRLVPLMPDAHVQLFNDEGRADLCPQAQAAYGVTLSDLDDGRVIAAGGPDLEPGDQVVAWGGHPVEQAREEVAFHCFPLGAATAERVRQVQLRLLARGPVDGTVVVDVLREGQPLQVVLSAQRDTRDIREALGIELPETLVRDRWLPSGMGYIAIGWEETYLAETRVQRALAGFADAPGVVIDLRDNDGGMDQPAANIAGMFSKKAFFYETITFLNNRTGEQEVISELWVEPGEIYWGRPAAVLINANTVSSGEGLAFLLSKMPQVQVFGFEGTAASFGSTGSSIALPGGWHLAYPGGRSLDARGRIQLDSDHTMAGGVVPDQRVPWTPDNRIRHTAGQDVVLDAAVAWLEEQTR